MSQSHSGIGLTAGTGMAAPEAAALHPRRKRALWRAWHRGTRGMDLIMGRFADREIGTVTEAELDGFEALLERQESEVYAWVTGEAEPPEGMEGELVERMKAFPGDI